MDLNGLIEKMEDKLAQTYTLITIHGNERREEQRPKPVIELLHGEAVAILDALKEYRERM